MLINILFLSLALSPKVPTSYSQPTDKICDGPLDIARYTMLELTKAASFSKDAEHHQQIGCIWKNKGLVNDHGMLLENNFKQAMIRELSMEYSMQKAEEKANEIVKKCKDANGKTADETSVKVLRCIGNWRTESFLEHERQYFH